MQPSGALRPLRILLMAVIAGTGLNVIITVANGLGGGRTAVPFRAPPEVLLNPVPDPLRPAFTAAAEAGVTARVADPTRWQAVLENAAGGAVTALVWLVIAVLAYRVVDAVRRADPFTVSTADALRRLGIVVLAAGGAAELIRAGAAYALYRSMFPSVPYDVPVPGLWWLPLGLAVLAFAAVVRHGCDLRAELDEVI